MCALDIRPLGGSVGAEINGVNLNELDRKLRKQIHDAFADHLVLFFRDQTLTPDAHRSLAASFGPVEVVPLLTKVDDDHPELVLVDSATVHTADVWHTDVTYRQNPPVMSILHMIECPPVGGDTMWCNLQAAYAQLSAPMKEFLEGLTAMHVNRYGEGHFEHPVVRVHPVTGRKSLYVNRIFTSHIRQVSRPESDALLPFLYRWCEQANFSVRFRWSPGAVAMWDNRATLHSVTNDFAGSRILHRATVLGDEPLGVSEPRFPKHDPQTMGASDFFGKVYPF